MLNAERLLLAIKTHSKSYDLLRWIATAIDKGKLSVERAERHSDTPDAAFDWLERNKYFIPPKFLPDRAHFREFANFFWTYVTTSFDVIADPGTRLQPGDCGCTCPSCARITNAPHLQPKKLAKADKRRADELLVGRLAALAEEEGLSVAPERFVNILADLTTRRIAAFSTYGQWLINRLLGRDRRTCNSRTLARDGLDPRRFADPRNLASTRRFSTRREDANSSASH
jgi:hypothetical protein